MGLYSSISVPSLLLLCPMAGVMLGFDASSSTEQAILHLNKSHFRMALQ